MTLSIPNDIKNVIGNTLFSFIDVGSIYANGFIEIRTGTKPPNPAFSATGTLLATLNFTDPAFGAFTNGTSAANTITSDVNIDNNGKAGWFRIYNKDGNTVMDGDITLIGGGGDIIFDNIDFLKGGTVQLTLTAAIP